MSRYMRKGTSRFFFVETIADPTAPSAAEVNAGTELTPEISEISGFTFSNNPINVPDMSSAFVNQIPGEDSTEDSSMTFYEEDDTNPISVALAKGTVGFIVIFNTGTAGASPAAADVADVWPVIVSSNAKQYTADNQAAKYMVKFSTTSPPSIDSTLA